MRPVGSPTLALLAASLGCLVMTVLRGLVTGSIRYGFLLWNLFLAWVPYALSLLIVRMWSRPGPPALRRPAVVATGLVWLFFYPNAPYILTDFIHVIQVPVWIRPERSHPLITESAVLWYDIILHSAFAFVGHIVGLISLMILQRTIRGRYGSHMAWGFAGAATLLGGYGIYLGRFVRFNSWDIFRDPAATVPVALSNLLNPKAVLFSLAFAFFIFLTYLIVWSLCETAQRREQPAAAHQLRPRCRTPSGSGSPPRS